MPKTNYRNVCIPMAIYVALEEIVEDEGSMYVSVSDLAKEALREKIIAIRSQTIFPRIDKSGGDGKR